MPSHNPDDRHPDDAAEAWHKAHAAAKQESALLYAQHTTLKKRGRNPQDADMREMLHQAAQATEVKHKAAQQFWLKHMLYVVGGSVQDSVQHMQYAGSNPLISALVERAEKMDAMQKLDLLQAAENLLEGKPLAARSSTSGMLPSAAPSTPQQQCTRSSRRAITWWWMCVIPSDCVFAVLQN